MRCRAVHDDVFKVMKYSFEEVVQGEGLVKLLEFWTQFVEPFFGLPPRPVEQLKVLPPPFPSAWPGHLSSGSSLRVSSVIRDGLSFDSLGSSLQLSSVVRAGFI